MAFAYGLAGRNRRREGRTMPQFRINPKLDIEALASAYAAEGRVRIYRLLEAPGVVALHDHLNQRTDWWHLINGPAGILELQPRGPQTYERQEPHRARQGNP